MSATRSNSNLTGVAYLKSRLKDLPTNAGIYKMYNVQGELLYIGKAKNIARRVSDYTSYEQLTARIGRMVSQIYNLEVITTRNDAEALLLEANLIRNLQPKYNILLKDDKSYPFVVIDRSNDFPRVAKYRGKQAKGKDCYGPFASGKDVDAALTELQKLFLLRPCSDSYFSSRTRPCLQYQIKRCSAPCVGKISASEYSQLVGQATRFLRGESKKLQQQLVKEMECASQAMDYERAAQLRDRIKALNAVQARQYVSIRSLKDADIIAIVKAEHNYAVQVFFVRGGQHYGQRTYFPAHTEGMEISEALEGFIGQFYQYHHPPQEVLLSEKVAENELSAALSTLANYKVKVSMPKIGDKHELVLLAKSNAERSLCEHQQRYQQHTQLLEGVALLFGLSTTPYRVELYDNSHISGRLAVGAMVVAGRQGFIKDQYRLFNIKESGGAVPMGGDDLAMHQQVLERRLKRLVGEYPEYEAEIWPDLIVIDGGKLQLNAALNVLAKLKINIPVIGMAKGEERDKGGEVFWLADGRTLTLNNEDPVMKYLQRLRDEAHRFAISSHRQRRSQALRASLLEQIPGIGPKRRKQLLNHFGSVEAITRAGIEDIMRVEGINTHNAQLIYNFFHPKTS